ncbi:S8 family serine peptidase [Halomicrococcus gelatinilyticus]|uniref:S8 family serine peptidase n=1 Tax=Halomicrococcus gelatinilyticus TaxID=1702103 RepID=UPI002E109740
MVSTTDNSPGVSAVQVDPALERAGDTTQVVVRLQEADVAPSTDRESAIRQLKRHARTTQRSVLAYAKRTDGVDVRQRFWLTNAVLLEVDQSQVDLDELAKESYVTQLHANFQVEIPEQSTTETDAAPARTSDDGPNTTYGVDQVNATEVWDAYGTKGAGVKVAVLDTGVDVSHPDIDLYTNDSSDPTYPGGWAEFDDEGNVVPGSEPHDTDSHGTHTSGTVSGGNASGEYIGVAPDVDLMHGLVLPSGGGSFAQVAGGMEWAVNQDADVISMSLGAGGYSTEMLEPVRNAHAAGVVVAASSGNSGPGSSGSPGNVYESVAVGATDADADVASFSSGEEIDTDAAWGSDAPESWPDSYVVPDVAAPGVSVKSSVPGGGYAEYDGTSMAAPHTAGSIALMLSASGGDLSNGAVKSALYETAWKPADEPAGNDTRYGTGIVDAKAATDLVALDNGVNGTVTDTNGTAVPGATVALADGSFSATTGPNGEYTLLAAEGEHTVTASAFGYESDSATVSVPNGSFVAQNFSLAPTLAVEPTQAQPDAVEGGESLSLSVRAANLESATIDLAGDYAAENATLFVNGERAAFGEPLQFDEPYSGELTVTVETTANTNGSIALEHTFAGLGDSETLTTGPTQVFEEYTTVGVVDDSGQGWGEAVAATLRSELPANYEVATVTSDTALDALPTYDGFVVQQVRDANAEEFVESTQPRRFGVVYLDQWGSDSNGIEARSDSIGDPESVDDDGFGSQPVVYELTDSHPIFEGIAAPGETVEIHTGSWGDHDWFDGTDATVLAEVGDQDGLKGSGFAVDDGSMTVLASSLGRTTYVGNGDYTDTADSILANAVSFAATGGNPVGTLSTTEDTVQPDGEASVRVRTDATDVAGYQANVTFDPSVVEVTNVEGIDFADPVVNVNNDEGWVYVSQAQATNADSPVFAEITFDVTAEERAVATNLSFVYEDTVLNAANGSTRYVDYSPGSVSVARTALGDVNGDGEVSAADATLVQRYIVGQPIDGPFYEASADMNGDDVITSADVTAILQKIVGANGAQATGGA